jgi:hypothetical protein
MILFNACLVIVSFVSSALMQPALPFRDSQTWGSAIAWLSKPINYPIAEIWRVYNRDDSVLNGWIGFRFRQDGRN